MEKEENGNLGIRVRLGPSYKISAGLVTASVQTNDQGSLGEGGRYSRRNG